MISLSRAVIMITEHKKPNWAVGTKFEQTNTPKPTTKTSDVVVIGTPLAATAANIEACRP